MKLLALLKALHSALEGLPSDMVMKDGDLLSEVVKKLDTRSSGRMAQVDKLSNSVVASTRGYSEITYEKFYHELCDFQPYRPLFQYTGLASNTVPALTRVYAAPVRTDTLTFLVLSASDSSEDFSMGYANIFPDGAMITTVDPLKQNDYYWMAGIQGVSTHIQDPETLAEYIKKTPSFWNAGFWYMYHDEPNVGPAQRAEQTLILRHNRRIFIDSEPPGPLEDYFSHPDRAGIKVIRGVVPFTWEYTFSKDGNAVEGVIRQDGSAVSVWSRAMCSIVLDESRLDPFFKEHNEKWSLFFMKSHFTTSEDLDKYSSAETSVELKNRKKEKTDMTSAALETYIISNDWSNPAGALFVSPQDRTLWTQWEAAKK